jgi:hypothetical protein
MLCKPVLILAFVFAGLASAGELEVRSDDAYFYAARFWETEERDGERALAFYMAYLDRAGETGTYTKRAVEHGLALAEELGKHDAFKKRYAALLPEPETGKPPPIVLGVPTEAEAKLYRKRAQALRTQARTLWNDGLLTQSWMLEARARYWHERSQVGRRAQQKDRAIARARARAEKAEMLQDQALLKRCEMELAKAESQRERISTKAGLAKAMKGRGLRQFYVDFFDLQARGVHVDVCGNLDSALYDLKNALMGRETTPSEVKRAAAMTEQVKRMRAALKRGDVAGAQRVADDEWSRIMSLATGENAHPSSD